MDRTIDDPGDWSIELLRGLAALLVVLAHYQALVGLDIGWLRLAFTGVDLFFVISGYVFAPYLFGRPLPLAAHLVRRFFRLYPMYAVALLCYAGMRTWDGQPAEHLFKHALFLHTLTSREIAFYYNPAFWSLPPEVEFYLALPALAGFAAWAGGTRSVAVMSVLAVLLHVLIACMSPGDPSATNAAWVMGFHLPGLLSEFMLGALAYWAVGQRPSDVLRWLLLAIGVLAWLALAALYVALGDAGVARHDVLRGNVGLLAALSFAAMLVAWVGWIRQPPVWLMRSSTVLGTLSYGVYLFHNAAPWALERFRASLAGIWFAVLCLMATVALAQLLHWLCEAPCRQYGRALARKLDRSLPP